MPRPPNASVAARASPKATHARTSALVALVYVCSGEIAFMWIVPPAQSAAVAPLFASGLALCLLWGYGLSPLVFVGSLALSLGAGMWQYGYSFQLFALAVSVALFATVHAISGAYLVRQIAGLRKPLLLTPLHPRPIPRRLEIEVMSTPQTLPPPSAAGAEIAAALSLELPAADGGEERALRPPDAPELTSLRARERFDALLRERTHELEEARTTAETANRAKTLFLANMTHELRTPMHAVLSYAQLGRDANPADQRDYFERIVERGQALLHLLSNLLDLARLESGSMSIEIAPHDLESLLRDQLRQMEAAFRAKQVSCEYRRTPDCEHASVLVDPVRIGQVFNNILNNAVRYSPAGGRIKVQLSRAALPLQGDNGAQLEIAISDEGVGIPENELELIFDKFVESSKTRTNAGGTGLGLALCRQIVALHDGVIVASNNHTGPGATVRVVLPLAASVFVERGAA